MSLPTQPLRDEHKELLPHVEHLREVADAVGDWPLESLRHGVDDAYVFLTRHLIPHAEAEDRDLYPVVGDIIGGPQATATMSRDHVEVGRLTQELGELRAALAGGALDPETTRALRRTLYGLYAVVRLHFAKEEEVYLPLLNARLTPAAAQRLFTAMGQAAAQAKGSHQDTH
jgi:iron-sulfur cluster repair protein YtfE (RIC family)